MMSLTTTGHTSRLIIKYGGVGVLGLMLFYWVAGVAVAAYKAAHPPYTPPTVRFGKLPNIVFPQKEKTTKTFKLELPNDDFPKMSDQAKVYVVYRPGSDLLAYDYYVNMAKEMGFTEEPIKINDGMYEFRNNTLNQTLTINILDGSFTMKYPYINDQLLLATEKVPGKDAAIAAAKAYLEQAERWKPDLDDGVKNVSFWRIEADGLKQVNSASEANVAKVDFNREEIPGEFKIMEADVNSASISVLVSGSSVEGKKILEVAYKYADIDRESFSTYPIKTPSEAWDEFSSGNYWPALDSGDSQTIIRKMYLAYFEPVTLTNYLQPIYVFEGDGNFIGYLPAIADGYSQ